ncbi:DMT family transporter [Actimicrobium sp. CCC2.4]|uniref:DMT family transporter n=1 Tax=Actimicrobium sp. CCC2.4 TaxID=3048606 RepID=UPI002AC9CFB4|nr:DMT family transporter [Actimicrobium sp. CCC2.4]MEB0134815.1 DMT family transporter [Actimicrobium sp. CCC2.4]WPX30753.1 DMT family transporter [Actimicrobium sp. CCC2.4]
MNSLLYGLAFFAGAAISMQAAINGRLALNIGGNTVMAALISFCIGTLILTFAAVSRGGIGNSLAALPGQPPWVFAGGVLGAGFLFTTAFLAPRIGLTSMLVLIIAGQLLMSITVDHFGLFGSDLRPVSPVRLIGVIVVLGGVLLTLFGDRIGK